MRVGLGNQSRTSCVRGFICSALSFPSPSHSRRAFCPSFSIPKGRFTTYVHRRTRLRTRLRTHIFPGHSREKPAHFIRIRVRGISWRKRARKNKKRERRWKTDGDRLPTRFSFHAVENRGRKHVQYKTTLRRFSEARGCATN